MGTLNERYESGNRPVKTTIGVPVNTLIRFEGIAHQYGMSRRGALEEAVGDWMVRHEQSLNRQNRLLVEKAMREAMDKQPIEDLLERFRKQMGETAGGEHKDLDRPLTAEPGTPIVPPMTVALTLAGRRKALGFSQQKLAELADCSIGTIRILENGYTPRSSEMADRLDQALTDAELVAKASA